MGFRVYGRLAALVGFGWLLVGFIRRVAGLNNTEGLGLREHSCCRSEKANGFSRL